jgi:membrane protease YdiL (CAAX protease family)
MCTHPINVYPTPPTKPGTRGPWPQATSELSKCMTLVCICFAFLGMAGMCRNIAYVGAFFSHAVVAVQLWGPLARADRAGVDLGALGLRRAGWPDEVRWALGALAWVLPLWGAVVYAARPWLMQEGLWPGAGPGAHLPGSPWAWAMFAGAQMLGVAVPEELFWRGYVQPVLQARWPQRVRLMGLGAGTVLATALFALGHVVGGQPIAALGTFAPGLMFALLRNRQGGLLGACLAHGACNVFSAWVLQTFDAL